MEKNIEAGVEAKKKRFMGKAIKGFAIFLTVMIGCTFISRGIYAYQMPQVEMGRMERKSIAHIISAGGTIIAVNENAVTIPAGIRIEEICVREGEAIEADTVLLRLDMECLTENMEALENQIVLAEQRLREMKSNQNFAAQTKQIEAARAKEDLDFVTKTQELNVQQVRRRYEDAKNELAAYPTWEAYFDGKIRQDSQYQALQGDPEQAEAFRIYAEAVQLSLQEQWEDGRKALEKTVKEAEMTLQMADNDRRLAVLQAERNVEDAGRETTDEKSSGMEAEQNIKGLQEKLEIYRKLYEQEGKIFSGIEGGVSTIYVSVGDRTSDAAAMILADGSKGWIFEARLSNEQRQYLNPNDTVTLRFRSGAKILEDCPILAATRLDGTNYMVTVEVGDEGLSMGEIGTLEISKKEGPYDCCVPLSAIHTIDNKAYIYVIRETDTILGTEFHVVRRQVGIIDENDSYAALEEGSLGEDEQFVVSCDRELASGDAVRPMEILY